MIWKMEDLQIGMDKTQYLCVNEITAILNLKNNKFIKKCESYKWINEFNNVQKMGLWLEITKMFEM